MHNTKKKHTTLYIVLGLIAIAIVAAGIYSHFGGFGTGKAADEEEFSKYATLVSEITIPEETQIIALGEATHGNSEFQQLKLDVFKVMVEKYGVRAFALEGDFGGCEAVNRYIHGGSGTAKDAVAEIGFAIYRTQEMEDLVSWMREYNQSAKEDEDLRFYGFDMQRVDNNYRYLLEAAQNAGIETSEFEGIWDEEQEVFSEDYTTEQRKTAIEKIKNELPKKDAKAIHFANILLQNIELGENAADNGAYATLRDRLMAENTMWILAQEESRGKDCIFVSGHNGHIERNGSYSKDSKVMGALLADELETGYFAIGTDFYRTECNLPNGVDGKRKNHTFYSKDPLAKASKQSGFDISYLDFSQIPDTSTLKEEVQSPISMGSLGEGYSFLMKFLPMTYRVQRTPESTFDGMIFVSDAHPTEIKAL